MAQERGAVDECRAGDQIESRILVTDQAIIDAVVGRSPNVVLDIGCGEGWLVRALAARGIPYVDGWRTGSWAGFSSDFTDPAPWYFRTMESWVKLLTESGFRVLEVREPLNPKTPKPASALFIAEVSG